MLEGATGLPVGCHYLDRDESFRNAVSTLQARQGLTKLDVDNFLGGTAAEFFRLNEYP